MARKKKVISQSEQVRREKQRLAQSGNESPPAPPGRKGYTLNQLIIGIAVLGLVVYSVASFVFSK